VGQFSISADILEHLPELTQAFLARSEDPNLEAKK
jgi:hypothetical protein